MFLTNLFNFNKTCNHDKITPDMESGYCPDCGKLIRNEWYIARCACCGVKLKAMDKNSKIVAQNHYCTNCGSEEYTIQKLEKINFVDINYAVLKKTIAETADNVPFTTQCWQEKTVLKPKLLAQYL